jgi:alpha-galactosidase
MAINCWFASGQGVRTTGLCHSVQHTADELASIMGLEDGTWSFRAAGINHQSWLLEYRIDGREALDELREAVRAYARGERDSSEEVDEWYGGGREQVRTAIMELSGHFPTESSHHASEYLPFFRRTPAETTSWIADRWDYLEQCRAHGSGELQELADELCAGPLAASEEYAAQIVDSTVTGMPRVVYGNVPNTGLITNLPDGCCVEVPCLVDRNGVQPTYAGALPATCAGINLATIGVQACTVEAYRTRSREAVHAALALDRLTSAVLSLADVHRLADELLEAQAPWLPAFS